MNFGLVAEKLRDGLYCGLLNQLACDSPYNVMAFLNTTVAMPVRPEFAVLPQKEIFQVSGPLLAIDFPSAKLIRNRFKKDRNFFYLRQIDWHKVEQPSYNNIAEVFLDEALSIIVNTSEEGNFVKNVWGREAIVIGELNVESIRKLIG